MVTPDNSLGNSQVHDVPRQKPAPPHLAVILDDCRDCPVEAGESLIWHVDVEAETPDRNVQGAVPISSGPH